MGSEIFTIRDRINIISTMKAFAPFIWIITLFSASRSSTAYLRQSVGPRQEGKLLLRSRQNTAMKNCFVPYSTPSSSRQWGADSLLLLSEVAHGDGDALDTTTKQTLRTNYRMVSILYGIIATIFLLMPDKTLTKKLASKFGGAAGFGVAAGVSYILGDANDNNVLNSETYKRLNVGLLGFSLLGLFAVPGEAAFLPTAAPAILLSASVNVSRLFALLVSYTGWSFGVQGKPVEGTSRLLLSPHKALREMFRGSKATLKGMRVLKSNKKKSLTYRNCVLLVLFGLFSSFMEGLFHVRYASTLNRTAFDSSLQWSAVSRLFLISTMIFSLKEAAEQDWLKRTTFIQLNILVGAWALLVFMGQGQTLTGFTTQRIEMLAFSLSFLIKGIKYQKFKSDDQRTGSILQPPDSTDENGSGDP